MKAPSFQFYPGDWMKDPALRACSVAARGLWIDMLCLMFESERRGYLTVGGKPASTEQIARMTGIGVDAALSLITELSESGVLSKSEHGCIFSRRLVRDSEISAIRKKCGKAGAEFGVLGGRPKTPNQTPKKPQTKPQTEGQNNPPSSSSSPTLQEIGISRELAECEAQYRPEYRQILDRWREIRVGVGLNYCEDAQTQRGAAMLTVMLADGQSTLEAIVQAMGNLVADPEARRNYTLRGLARNLSAWIERTKSDGRPQNIGGGGRGGRPKTSPEALSAAHAAREAARREAREGIHGPGSF